MGKWSFLKGKLKPVPVEVKFDEGASYQEKVDKVKEKFAGSDLADLANTYNELCEVEAEIKAAESEMNVHFEAVSQLLITRLEDQGLSSFKLPTGENFFLKEEPRTTVKDKTAVREWCENNGLKEILAPAWQTLNAMVKGILEDPIDPATNQPRPLPDGIEVFMNTTVQRRQK